MMTRATAQTLVLLFSMILMTSSATKTVAAEDIDFNERAQELYDSGMKFYEAGQYKDATRELLESYSLIQPGQVRRRQVLLAIAKAFKMLWWAGAAGSQKGRDEDRDKAVLHFELFINDIKSAHDATDEERGQVDKARNQIAELRNDTPPEISFSTPSEASPTVTPTSFEAVGDSPSEERRLASVEREQAALERSRAEQELMRARQERQRAEEERLQAASLNRIAEGKRIEAESRAREAAARAKASEDRAETPGERAKRLKGIRSGLGLSGGILMGGGGAVAMLGLLLRSDLFSSTTTITTDTSMKPPFTVTQQVLMYSGGGCFVVGAFLVLLRASIPDPVVSPTVWVTPHAGTGYAGVDVGGVF